MKRSTIAGCALLAVAALFGSGLLVGRQFPARHYERLGQTNFLYDSASGKACNPLKAPSGEGDPFSKYLVGKIAVPAPTSGDDLVSHIYGPNEPVAYPPPCGK
ncbi:MAG: hypothetical protein ACYCSN_11825 [Acidobacteriaceae bacterium]